MDDAPAMSPEDYRVSLDVFEGPLDLLLYLIRKEQVSIYDIPVAKVTKQYLEVLKTMQDLNLDVAADFLVMAATLLQVKSRMLLPTPPELEGIEEEGPDPREELVRALLEYERYRQVAEQLAERPRLGRDEFTRTVHDDELGGPRGIHYRAGLFDLVTAFGSLVERLGGDRVHQVLLEPVTIRERISDLLDRVPPGGSVLFEDLFLPYVEAAPPERRRIELVITFLAVLELVRAQVLRVTQSRHFAPLTVERSVEDVDVTESLRLEGEDYK